MIQRAVVCSPCHDAKRDSHARAPLLDLDGFERNITKMAAHVKAAGKKLRPHSKTHKCSEIARRQIAAGAGA